MAFILELLPEAVQQLIATGGRLAGYTLLEPEEWVATSDLFVIDDTIGTYDTLQETVRPKMIGRPTIMASPDGYRLLDAMANAGIDVTGQLSKELGWMSNTNLEYLIKAAGLMTGIGGFAAALIDKNKGANTGGGPQGDITDIAKWVDILKTDVPTEGGINSDELKGLPTNSHGTPVKGDTPTGIALSPLTHDSTQVVHGGSDVGHNPHLKPTTTILDFFSDSGGLLPGYVPPYADVIPNQVLVAPKNSTDSYTSRFPKLWQIQEEISNAYQLAQFGVVGGSRHRPGKRHRW